MTNQTSNTNMTDAAIRAMIGDIAKLIRVDDSAANEGLIGIEVRTRQDQDQDEIADMIETVITRQLGWERVSLDVEDDTIMVGFQMPSDPTDGPMTEGVTGPIAPTTQTPDPMVVIAQITALTKMIADMSPEAKQLAFKMGLIAKSQVPAVVRQTGDRPAVKPRTPKVTELRACACGCGGATRSSFLPGHDATAKGRMIRAMTGKMTQDELSWRPSAELKAYVASHPEWQARFGAWIATMSRTVTGPVSPTVKTDSAE